MLNTAAATLIVSIFLIGGLIQPAAGADLEPEQVVLLPNEEYVGSIDHKNARYLRVTLLNLADEASTCRIHFYKERVELAPGLVGPAEFRTFTLEAQNDRQTRIWTTLHFDEFTLNVDAGKVQAIVEQTMTVK